MKSLAKYRTECKGREKNAHLRSKALKVVLLLLHNILSNEQREIIRFQLQLFYFCIKEFLHKNYISVIKRNGAIIIMSVSLDKIKII